MLSKVKLTNHSLYVVQEQYFLNLMKIKLRLNLEVGIIRTPAVCSYNYSDSIVCSLKTVQEETMRTTRNHCYITCYRYYMKVLEGNVLVVINLFPQ